MPEPQPRWWVYAREHIVGPYEAEALRRLPVYGPDLPLCPEAVLGAAEERWARAADVSSFSEDFPPEARTPPGAEPPKPGPWPPDPDLSAVDIVASAQSRLDLVDQSLGSTQERLNARHEAYERLLRETAARAASVKDLHKTLSGIGARLGRFLLIGDGVEQARAALAMQDQRVDGLDGRLQGTAASLGEFARMRESFEQARAELKAQNSRVAELEGQLRRLEDQMKEAPPPPAAAPRSPARAPSAPEASTAKPPRRKPSGDDFGLPPTTVDVPDFQ